MSSITMKSILGTETIITPEQERILSLADYEVIKALHLFPEFECNWYLLNDYEITHFGTWCHHGQVLTVHFWGFFKR